MDTASTRVSPLKDWHTHTLIRCNKGTWVPSERGLALATQYGVDHLLQPIIDYVATQDSPPQAPKHVTAPSTRVKKVKLDADPDHAGSPGPRAASARQNAATSKAAAKAAAAQHAAQAATAAQAAAHLASQAHAQAQAQAQAQAHANYYQEEPERSRLQQDEDRSLSPSPSDASSHSRTPSPIESGGSDYDPTGTNPKKRKHDQAMDQGPQMDMHPASSASGGNPMRYARLILDYFVSESTQIPQFLVSPPADFDANVIIDDDGHTALHWACAMGRIRIVKLLLTAGADIFRANAMGQTALMRSVMFTNNYDLRKFPELFELLHRSTINIDSHDRTVFHYVVDIALQKGKTHASRYYMETILVRLADYPREVADILNFQDNEGETALTLAARARSRRLVKILLENNADGKLANKEGKSAEDYILEDERFRAPSIGPGGLIGAHAYPAQLHYSETGQRTSGQVIPQVSGMLESLATSFDTELQEKERDLAQANSLLTNIQNEISASQKTVSQLKEQSEQTDNVEGQESQLETELGEQMAQRFKMGWEKYVAEEEARSRKISQAGNQMPPDLASLYALPSGSEGLSQACDQTRGMINKLQQERGELFTQYASLQAEAGTGQKMDDYRKLVALGCNLPVGDVDSIVNGLQETLEQDQGNFGMM